LSRELRYWDANAFLAFFQEEAGRVDSCEAILEEAEAGKILIVTSALTLAEVLAIRGAKKLPPLKKMKNRVINFFKHEYIAVQNVTREVAEMARDLVWDKGIKPKDAVHVASAIVAEVAAFETFDKPLIRKSGKVEGLIIREPPPRAQPRLPLGEPNVRRAAKDDKDEEEAERGSDWGRF
jgi:predicted nucleic acid-binding protein